MIGKTISHYEILEKLGEGGMGVVYKAEDTKLKRSVALKFLPPELTRTAEWKERFVREAQAAAALAHPSICHTYEIDEAEDQTFIAMEHIDGKSLAEKIGSGPLDAEEAVNILLRVAEGLKHAHKRGIIHRDIKPANIMVTEDGQAKVMDFGLAKLTGRSRLTGSATIMGTVAYMSPEQARGDTAVDHRTDIWSLGIVLYEMLTGKLPFEAETDSGLIYKIVHEEPEPIRNHRSGIPDLLASIVEKTMQKDPKSRYKGAEELIPNLETIKSGASVSVESSSPSIAVLPFVNMSADPEQEYFCDGIAEELINALTQLENLHVVARTSAFFFKGKDVKIRDIGRELNVATVLEGSVRKAGNRLRITAQLVNVDDGYHLWSERYDREMKDIFGIQDEITLAIVDKLKPRLLGEEKTKLAMRRAVDLEAYNLYLRGRWFVGRLTQEAFEKAIECFEQATERERDYAEAYAGLAECYAWLPVLGPFESKQTFPKAREAALRALQLDDTLAEAHRSMASVKALYDWDWEGGEREYKRAIELNPGDVINHQYYAVFLGEMGRHDEAINEVERALELDPLSLHANQNAGIVFCSANEPDRAINVLRRILEMDPNYGLAHFYLGLAYWLKSKYEEATAEFQMEMEGSSGSGVPAAQAMLGGLYAMMGRRDESMQILEDLVERSSREYVSAFFPALVSFALGEVDRGFEWLDKAYEEHDLHLSLLNVSPLVAILDVRSDPRYTAMLKKIGLDK